jgi:hypothetical protein
MPARDPERRLLQSRTAAAVRHDLPEALELRRDLAARRLEDYITKVVEAAPPLSDEQVRRLSVLLNPAGAA